MIAMRSVFARTPWQVRFSLGQPDVVCEGDVCKTAYRIPKPEDTRPETTQPTAQPTSTPPSYTPAGGEIGAGEARDLLEKLDQALFSRPECFGTQLDQAKDLALALRTFLSTGSGSGTFPLSGPDAAVAAVADTCAAGPLGVDGSTLLWVGLAASVAFVGIAIAAAS